MANKVIHSLDKAQECQQLSTEEFQLRKDQSKGVWPRGGRVFATAPAV
jgi:hypothetical protein